MAAIDAEQYARGLQFMRNNFPCGKEGHCEGCEIDFQHLLEEMAVDYSVNA